MLSPVTSLLPDDVTAVPAGVVAPWGPRYPRGWQHRAPAAASPMGPETLQGHVGDTAGTLRRTGDAFEDTEDIGDTFKDIEGTLGAFGDTQGRI